MDVGLVKIVEYNKKVNKGGSVLMKHVTVKHIDVCSNDSND